MKRMRYCQKCGEYTLKQVCSRCGEQTVINSPQKYSNDELVSKYRREIKKSLMDKGE